MTRSRFVRIDGHGPGESPRAPARSTARHPRSFAGVLAALVLATSPAAADGGPSETEKETARNLLHDGYVRATAGDLTEALRAYRAADAIMHVPTTGLAVAKTLAALGRLVEARGRALAVARSAPEAGESDPMAQARGEAAALADALAGRIGAVVVDVTGTGSAVAGTLVVTVDGVAVPVEALRAPWKVDPGDHRVAARSEDRSAERTVRVGEGETVPVALALAPAAPPRAGAAGGGPPAWVYASLGVGAAGVALGGVTGIVSWSATSDLQDACTGGTCPAGRASELDRANAFANVSNVAFAVGAAAALVGVVGWAVGGRRPAPSAGAVGARSITVRF